MTKEKKLSVARALKVQLHAAEEAIDTALSEAAQLIETYVTSRRAVGKSTVMGTDVHQNTLKAMKFLNSAQQHMATAHEGLVRVSSEIGLTVTAVDPGDNKPGPKDGVSPDMPQQRTIQAA